MRNARHRVGEIGEAAFVLKATQLGLRIAKPLSGKESYDYIVNNGRDRHLVQVKTTSKRASKTAYHVTIARGATKSVPYRKSDFDFLVIYVIPEQTFYVLPQKALAGRVAISVPSTRRKNLGPFAQHLEHWALLLPKPRPRSKGLTLQASADPAYPDPTAPNPTLRFNVGTAALGRPTSQ
jgi:hypothetical protein